MNIKKKIALVTGANRGIGRAIAEILIERNIIVIGTSTTQVGVKIINNYLNKHGKGMQLDVTDQNSINRLLETVYLEFNNIDILINNAAIKYDNLLIKMKDKEWSSILETNLTSVYKISKIIIKKMIKNRYGRIINISSIAGYVGNIGQVNYAAAKAGLIGFSKSLALEVASFGITVNLVSPGFILTDMTKDLTDKYRAMILSRIPANRFGEPKEVANVVAFLASDEAAYITGETIHINGGMYML